MSDLDTLLTLGKNSLSSNKPVKFVDNVYVDLDFFHNNDNDSSKSVYHNLNHTKTIFGDHLLKHVLTTPTTDVKLLKERQKIIGKLVADDKGSEIENLIRGLTLDGKELLWYWQPLSEEQQTLHDMIYYSYPIIKLINKQKHLLSLSNFYKIYVSPTITIMTPIACLFAPVIIAKLVGLPVQMTQLISFIIKGLFKRNLGAFFNGTSLKTKLMTLFTVGMWFFYYIYGAYQTVMSAINTNKVINLFADRVREVDHLITVVEGVKERFDRLGINLGVDVEEELKLFRGFITTSCGFFKGGVLVSYYKLLELKDKLIPLLNYLGVADMYNSIAVLYRKFEERDNRYSFAKYKVNAKRPYMKCEGVWHSAVTDGSVLNDIRLSKKHPNALITGPNMGGKSTFIKAVLIAAVLGQTVGLVPAGGSMEFTPYSCFNSCLRIPDSTGYVSEFEAEMHNNYKQLEMLKELEKDQFVLSIIDEIFTSTNTLEGVSAAQAICEKLCEFKNSQSIVTTHYTELTDLERSSKRKFVNYRFGVERVEGKIVFPYKIEKGISTEYIALELLKENQFDPEIVERAKERLRSLIKERVLSEERVEDEEKVEKSS